MISKLFLFLFTALVISFPVSSQETKDTKYWIIFTDKGEFKPNEKIVPGSKAYTTGKSLLNERAIKRRLKVLSEENLIDFQDLPVEKKYISNIKSLGVEIIGTSRWLNGVSAYLTSSQVKKLQKENYVQGLRLVDKLYKQEIEMIKPPFLTNVNSQFDTFDFTADPKDIQRYGKSFKQMDVVNVLPLHKMNITGRGVLMANLDDGFDWRNHESLRDLNVIAEYDFINKDENTFYEGNQKYPDVKNQGKHGTATLSTMSGFKEGKLISPAYDSDIILAKSEYVASETPMEEDFWIEAAEWVESKGADIITSSLIYKEYDPPYEKNSYDYKNYDGNTAITTIAGDRAAYLGVVVLNAMGNYYQTNPPSLGSAADGDSIISVGAVTLDGLPANFTSNGPTSDGRIKPDVSAPGVLVYASVVKEASGNDSTYEFTSGTSFSTPITAGIAALILSVHPELTPMQVRDALRNTASNTASPNNTIGWGIVNAYNAVLYNGMAWSNKPVENFEDGELTISINLASKFPIDLNSVTLHYSYDKGATFESHPMKLKEALNDGNNSGLYQAVITPEFAATEGSNVVYYFTAKDSMKEYSYRGYDKKYFMYGK